MNDKPVKYTREQVIAALWVTALSVTLLACKLYAARWPNTTTLLAAAVIIFAGAMHIPLQNALGQTIIYRAGRDVGDAEVDRIARAPAHEQERIARAAGISLSRMDGTPDMPPQRPVTPPPPLPAQNVRQSAGDGILGASVRGETRSDRR